MNRLRVILLFLLLGAIVNVAVAWGLSYWIEGRAIDSRVSIGGVFTQSKDWMSFTHNRAVGLAQILWSAGFDIPSLRERRITKMPPSWSSVLNMDRFHRPPESPQETFPFWAEQASGLPFLSMSWSLQDSYSNVFDSHDFTRTALRFPDVTPRWFGRSEIRALPLLPIWSGFLFNTCFYTGLLWACFIGPFAIRRKIRRKRGLCLKCGYDLQGVDHTHCPECGEEIRKGKPA